MVDITTLVDNDVLIKCAAYKLLTALSGIGPTPIGVLGAARYVVTSAIRHHDRLNDPESAEHNWRSFLAEVVELEPRPIEIKLATCLEQAAGDLGLALDVGESQLYAMAIMQPETIVLTGDKRSIKAAEQLREIAHRVTSLDGRVACLEQAVEAMNERFGFELIRALVCSEPGADKAMSICFSCWNETPAVDEGAGLRSYIATVRETAPNLLVDSLLNR